MYLSEHENHRIFQMGIDLRFFISSVSRRLSAAQHWSISSTVQPPPCVYRLSRTHTAYY